MCNLPDYYDNTNNQSKGMQKMKIIWIYLLILSAVILGFGSETMAAVDMESHPARQQKALALQITEKALSDENPRIRTKAIEVVSTCEITALMPQVLHLAKDPVVPVRFSAVLAIGDRTYSRAIVTVKRLLEDRNKNIRIAAAYAMVRFGNNEFVDPVRDAMNDADPTIQANAAWLLGKLADTEALTLLYAAKDDLDADERVRFRAVEAIAKIGDKKIYSKIWTMLLSKYADVRIGGIESMSALGSVRASDAMITMLDDEVVEVRLTAARYLGILADNSGEVVVKEYFANPPKRRNKQAKERQDVLAALAIGRIKSKALRPFLPELLKSKSQQVRLAVAKAVLLPKK